MFNLRRIIRAGVAMALGAIGALTYAQSIPTTIRIGFVETASPGYLTRTVLPVARAVEQSLPGTRVSLIGLSSISLVESVSRRKPDFVISPAADFLRIVDAMGAHPIATRKSSHAQSPVQSAGATIIAKVDRSDITDLKSLKGKRIASTLPTSIDGWLGVRMELEKQGFDSNRFFGQVDFLNFSIPNVFVSVLSNAYDAGTVPTCLLERAQDEGLIEAGLLKVINSKEDGVSTCAHSTDLYPDLITASLPWTDEELVRSVTITLLGSANDASDYSWYGTSDFHSLRNLEETLHIGPWSYLEDWSVSGIWNRFKAWIWAFIVILLGIAFNEWRLRKLVIERTKKLTKTMEERDRLAASHAQSRERISQMERIGAISQLCTMIAHELKQPVGAVLNYLAVIRLTAMKDKSENPLVNKAMTGAEQEARRIAQIIDRVRGYARKQRREAVKTNLNEVIQTAKKNLSVALKKATKIELNLAPQADVMGEPLELELLFLNLMKNAAQAVADMPDGKVTVVLRNTGANIEVTVTDNGPYLDDNAFKKLTKVSESVKEDGLGLGLGIVRSLVDENGGRLQVERLSIRGLCFTVTFDAADAVTPQDSKAQEPHQKENKNGELS